MDCAVQGRGFFVGATPQLDNLLLEVIKKVKLRKAVNFVIGPLVYLLTDLKLSSGRGS